MPDIQDFLHMSLSWILQLDSDLFEATDPVFFGKSQYLSPVILLEVPKITGDFM